MSFVDDAGQPANVSRFVCVNDEQAISLAWALVDRRPMIVWEGNRFVCLLEPHAPEQAPARPIAQASASL